MSRNRPKPKSVSSRASAAVAIIIALVVLQIAVTGAVLSGGRDEDLTVRRVDTLRAFYASEGAMNMAIREYALQADESGDGTAGSIATFTLAPATARVTSATNAATGIVTLDSLGTSAVCNRSIRTSLRRQAAPGGGGGLRGLKFESWNLTSAPSSVARVPFSTTPTFAGTIPNVNWPTQSDSIARWLGAPTSRWGIRFSGAINIPTAGNWSFGINSDDGSQLYIDGALVINNDGLHGMVNLTGSVVLGTGYHTFEIRYFENGGNNGMIATWRSPSESAYTVIPSSAFSSAAASAPLSVNAAVQIYGDPSANSTSIDAFDATLGAYGGANISTTGASVSTNSTTTAAWQMNGRARLQGSALVGPGGSPSGVVVLSDRSSITGTITAAASRAAIFIGVVPSPLASSSGTLSQFSGSLVIAGDRRYTALTVGGTTAVTITASCVIRVDNDLIIQDDATLALLNSANVTLSVGGNVSIVGDAAVNVTPGRPDDLALELTGSGDNVLVARRGQLVATVSNALGTLIVTPSTNQTGYFSGRFAGGSVQTADKARIHLNVPAAGSGGGGAMVTVLSDWLETP